MACDGTLKLYSRIRTEKSCHEPVEPETDMSNSNIAASPIETLKLRNSQQGP